MSSPDTNSLAAADLAWLHVQTPNNLSVSTVVLTFDRPIDVDCLKGRIEDQLMAFARFRQRVEPSRIPLARPTWHEPDDFALSDHLIIVEPGSPDAPASLEGLVGDLLGRPLDETRPLWQLHVITEIDGKSAMVARVHQSVADGTVVPYLALQLTDADPSSATDLIGLEPWLPTAQLLERAQTNTAHTRMLCELIASRADTANPFRAPLTTAKVAAWSAPVSLTPLRDHASQLDVSIAQVLLAAVAGGLRSELHGRDTPVENTRLRALVPINLRSTGDLPLGTRMAIARLELPLAPTSAAARLEATGQEFERLRLSPESLTVLGTVPRRGISMSEIEERALRLLGNKATAMIGLHSGPQSTARLCSQPITGLMWWPALPGDLPLAVSVVAYGSAVSFGVAGEQSVITDARGLVDRISASLDRIVEPG